jgi:metal-responsive CopG/Arc/MetJ family transcriptional regulator
MVSGVFWRILGGIMSENKKVKFTVYLDEDMLKQTDKVVEASGCKSRNEFIIKAIESYIAELTLKQANPVLVNKLAEVISKSNDVALEKIKSGLFRYAVFLDVAIQMMADCLEVDEDDLDEYRRLAYNNVRRTKGRIPLDAILLHTGIKDED